MGRELSVCAIIREQCILGLKITNTTSPRLRLAESEEHIINFWIDIGVFRFQFFAFFLAKGAYE